MKTQYNKLFVYFIASTAAMGGLLFGFDTGVISGAIPYFQPYFGIDDSVVESITTAGLAGAIIGALFCGRITDMLGRRIVILASAVIFAVGALWSGLAASPAQLIAARLFLGIAIGVSSFAVPLYIAEISPARIRGRLVSLFQLMVTIGIFVSYLSDLFFADNANPDCWRPMFYIGVVPAVILFTGMWFLPETPCWLLLKGREDESRRTLSRIEGPDMAETSLAQTKARIAQDREQSGWREIFKPWLRNALIIAIGVMFFQQSVGINTIMYYCPKIFLMAGFADNISAIWASVGVGIVNVVFTIVALSFVDRLGRRRLYFLGMSGIFVSLICLAMCFAFNQYLGDAGKWLSIITVFLYIIFFAASIGPLGWLIITEIFPLKVRGLGSSIGSLSVWVFNSIVAFTFFKIVKAFTLPGSEIIVQGESTGNPAGAFLFYAFIALVGIIWGYFYIPETKGIPLEKIEKHWLEGGSPRKLKND
ncbi:MAG: sugar porter family MFS transporter [Prevotellaceae bacterium]|jgi:sugar porter (SP) family MFS transporter|nr:sugar porter family MFS transporter [Prevotellaceae bacterium]